MSDDWAKKFVAAHKREREEQRQKEEDERRKRTLAEARGPEKFQRVGERIAQDIHVLKDAPTFQSAEVDLSENGDLTVVFGGAPHATLKLTLADSRLIQYQYSFSQKPGSRTLEVQVGPTLKTLRICSDLDAIITVHDDESGKVFSDDADVSEFLLMPLLDHINSQ
jgi:hypothetical protein